MKVSCHFKDFSVMPEMIHTFVFLFFLWRRPPALSLSLSPSSFSPLLCLSPTTVLWVCGQVPCIPMKRKFLGLSLCSFFFFQESSSNPHIHPAMPKLQRGEPNEWQQERSSTGRFQGKLSPTVYQPGGTFQLGKKTGLAGTALASS